MTAEYCPTARLCGQPPRGEPSICQNPYPALKPFALAENICASALRAQLDDELRNTDDWDPSLRDWRQAWAQTELALSLPEGDVLAADHFDDVNVHLDRIDARETAFGIIFNARMLEAFLPKFKARQQNRNAISLRQSAMLSRNLGTTVMLAEKSNDGAGVIRNYRTKAALCMLMNRPGVDLDFYLASAREGRNRHYPEQNHDAYVLAQGVKAPVKCRGANRRRGEIGSGVFFLSFRQIALSSFTHVRGIKPTNGEQADEVATLLAHESHGEHLVGWERDWIESLTVTIASELRDYSNLKLRLAAK